MRHSYHLVHYFLKFASDYTKIQEDSSNFIRFCTKSQDNELLCCFESHTMHDERIQKILAKG